MDFMYDLVNVILLICEIVFGFSIIFVRVADRQKSQDFFSRHRFLAILWVISAIVGYMFFLSHLFFR